MQRSNAQPVRLLYSLIIAALILSQTAVIASASPGGSSNTKPERFQDTVSISVLATVRSSEVEPPPGDWFLKQAILDELNIDIDFQWLASGDDYAQVLQTRAAANDLPDTFIITPISVPILVDQGLLGDWTPLLPSMPTYVAERNVEALRPIGTYDDQLLTLTTASPDPYKGQISIRQDWLDALGLEVPTTTEEFLQVMIAFTQQDPDGNGQNDTYGWSGSVDSLGQIGNFDSIFGAFGALGDWKLQDNTLVPQASSEGRRLALDFIRQMNEAGVIDPDWTSQTGQDFQTKWKAGRVGILYNDWCATFCLQGYGEFVQANPTGKLEIISPPVGPNGESSVSPLNTVGSQYGISTQAAGDERGEAVARFFEWITTAGYERTAFGALDVDYTKAADGTITQNTDLPHLIQRQLCGWAYKGGETELRARYGTVTEYPNGQTIDVYAVLEKSATLPKTDITSFAPLPPMPVEISADLQRTIAEGQFAFATGTRPIEEWDAYVDTLNSLGLTTWVEQASERGREIGLIT
ncbi:MAG: extracellular solute-binding protein [Thermomicrobiales bacterium]